MRSFRSLMGSNWFLLNRSCFAVENPKRFSAAIISQYWFIKSRAVLRVMNLPI